MIALLFMLMLPPGAEAAPLEKMMRHLSLRVSGADAAFKQACTEGAVDSPDAAGGEWELSQFFLTINPSVSFGLTGFLDLEISPDLTLIWEKVDPDNWTE